MDTKDFILPYPYEAYTKFNSLMNNRSGGFQAYKEKIYKWVESNTSNRDITVMIDFAFSAVEENHDTKKIKEWFMNHSDKLRFMYDFSGVEFGVIFRERIEKMSIIYPSISYADDKVLYPGYDHEIFADKDFISKLDWLYENSEFIPFRVISDDLHDDYSHKFSHIKQDEYFMKKLSDYLGRCHHQPNDEVYYFIKYNQHTSSYYLKRDLDMSPKNE